ncbi:MAG TPA: hypothetical protein VKP65_10320, partial [Rhodothermales bacterium]|nr:hypothetical protein [Rhodothermales bacterium]
MLFAALTLLLFTGCPMDPETDADEAIRTLVDAEFSFAQASVAEGMRASFLTFLGDSATVFRPGPVNGRAWFTERPSNPGTLNWWPRYADLSNASDLGFTTGPWVYSDSAGTPVAYGHYVSVWQKQPSDIWRIVLDAGITHGQSFTYDSTVTLADRGIAVEEVTERAAARAGLQQADQSLIQLLESAAPDSTTLMAFWADDVRGYREGQVPVRGKHELEALRGGETDSLRWIALASSVAQSGDLGYSYGSIHRTEPAGPPAQDAIGGYLRIWR